MTVRDWWSAREIAEAGLPGCPSSRQKASAFIARVQETDRALVRARAGRGGGLELHSSGLPEAARAELDRRARAAACLAAAAFSAPTPKRQTPTVRPALPPSALTGRQRQVMEARAAVLAHIDSRVAGGEGSRAAVIEMVVAEVRAGLAADLAPIVTRANDKGRGLGRSAIYDWYRQRDAGGSTGLAPIPTRAKSDVPAWLDQFLPFYARPTKPDLTEAYRQWAKTLPVGEAPTYAAVRRAIGKLSHLERAKGREGKLKMRERMAFTARDTSDLQPTSIYVADGTTWDAEIEHPIHGRPFRPEITTIIDAATRRIVGWSVGLSESRWVVADALRRAAAGYGIPAIFYTDRGSGYRNETMDASLTGILARLGTTPMRALPYNSQAKGIVEAVQKLWIGVAREFPTYVGRDMDREARQLAFRTTRREIAFVGSSRILPTWTDFVVAVEAAIAEHADTPHRGLPQIREPGTGRKRHMTPAEMWAQKCAAGLEPILPSAAEAEDLFRPYEVRRCRRCVVTIGGNSYFATGLDRYHEQDVVVGYDVGDASRVWVREIDLVDGERVPGRLVAVAEFEGHKTRYVPVSMEQQAMERRAEGRRRRLQDRLDTVEAELRPGVLLEQRPVVPFVPVVVETATASAIADEPVFITAPDFAPAEGPADSAVRPRFRDDIEFARWLAANPGQATATDRELAAELLGSDTTRKWLRAAGVDLDRVRAVAIGNAA